MQNFTICISQPIRERMNLAKGDQVILSMDAKGNVSLLKGLTGLDGLVGIGKNKQTCSRHYGSHSSY